ncbi:MAG: prepilin-type N-terminal cleavage/methylation domain-containing protein [Candidatus Omnitrophica bacterium]|nr:prepilin-type N-terminal cleavage/methylation domain-containing protein [Candidatus Omnitrophota bacterium]
MNKRQTRGFTLIELLIVVAIIGILAAIAVPNFLNAQMRAKIARVDADVKTIMTAFEMYRLDNNDIPRWGALGWYRAWACLTTPVAYLSTPPYDMFQPEQAELFVNDHRFYEFNGCNGRTPMKSFNSGQNVTDYVVVSLGPDQDDDTLQISDYPNSGKFLQYDLSNGIISDGDLLKESHPGLNPQRG